MRKNLKIYTLIDVRASKVVIAAENAIRQLPMGGIILYFWFFAHTRLKGTSKRPRLLGSKNEQSNTRLAEKRGLRNQRWKQRNTNKIYQLVLIFLRMLWDTDFVEFCASLGQLLRISGSFEIGSFDENGVDRKICANKKTESCLMVALFRWFCVKFT